MAPPCSTQVQSMIPWAQCEVKSRVARKSLTWNFQGERLKNHLGSSLTFKSPFKVEDRFVITCSNSMLAVSGCSLGSVWACIGFHVSFWAIFSKLVAWFPGEKNNLRPYHRFMLGDFRNSMQLYVIFWGCTYAHVCMCMYMYVYYVCIFACICVYMHVYVCICIPKRPNLANLRPNRSPSWRQLVMLGWSWAQSDSDGPPNWCTWKSKSRPKWRNLGPFGSSFTPNWERCFKRSVRFEDFGLDRLCASFWNHMGFNLGRSCS